MGYDETAHREHIKWCCQQLSAMTAIDGLSHSEIKALTDSIDHLNQTFADRSRLEGALSRHLEKTRKAEEDRLICCNKLGEIKDKVRDIEKENSENKSKIQILEKGSCILAAHLASESASRVGRWMNRGHFIGDTWCVVLLSGIHPPKDQVESAVDHVLKRTYLFERHPKNGMFRKRRNLKPGA